MNPIEIGLARARDDFIEAFARMGFSLEGETLRGSIEIRGEEKAVEIRMSAYFPYKSPKIRPGDWSSGPMSWHQEPGGWLCLYSEGESADLPWFDPVVFLERVAEWFEHDLAGWPDDPPDLDLERYIQPTAGFVVYRDIDGLIGRPIRAELRREKVIEVVGRGTGPLGRMGRMVFGWVEDVGEIERPFRDWSELAPLLGERADRLERDIQRNRGELLMVKYSRGPLTGTVALRVKPGAPVEMSAMKAADASNTTLNLRSGPDLPELLAKKIAIVGLGAVGSFLADMFARGGIGHMTLCDEELLRPGNSVRHLCGSEYWGLTKADAVRDRLTELPWVESDQLVADARSIDDPADAANLLETEDLVIDATASGPTTLMFSDAANHLHRPLISVCIQREGDVVRVDRWPLGEGEAHAESVPPREVGQELREAGCGDPVSPSPPTAAIEAASLAWRVSVDLLAGRHLMPASVVQITGPNEEPPFDRLGPLG